MNAISSFCREEGRMRKRRKRRRLLLSVLLIAALSLLFLKAFIPSGETVPSDNFFAGHAAPAYDPSLKHPPAITDSVDGDRWEQSKLPEYKHLITSREIAAGDTLTAIFDNYGIDKTVLHHILSADEPILALDVLRPGNRFTFTFDHGTNQLICMELFIHPGSRIRYNRVDETSFDYQEITIPGEWKQELLTGEINGNFYVSALKSGLTDQETGNVTELFRDHIRFSSDIRPGDRFQVIRSRQCVEGEFTGQSRIEGIRIFRGSRIHTAFLFDDGNYYDKKGNSLARAFRRFPMVGNYSVSSHFSKARRNPITRRIAPHYGVDFAMPTGTPILSTGDGVVTRIRNHPFAGKYIEIQHGSQYTTRYLHLSRILVRQGQTVERGQRIALSGNTGRSTGPHLHFELHVRGRPVNPLTADIPMASAVPDERRADFNRLVGELTAMMELPQKVAFHRNNDGGN